MEIYLKYNQINASYMKDWCYDFIVIHDPQPAALIESRGKEWHENGSGGAISIPLSPIRCTGTFYIIT